MGRIIGLTFPKEEESNKTNQKTATASSDEKKPVKRSGKKGA